VIAGNAAAELETQPKRDAFELLREKMNRLTVITFDELFARVEQSVGVSKKAAEIASLGA
jgi:hypothetical protein